MLSKIIQIFKIRDLRKSILFVLGMLVLFRLAAHVPLPGVDVEALRDLFSSNQILGLLNIMSGGAMRSFSLVAMGIGPYITASIIMQLLTMIVPALEELSKEGESGHQKINQYTRLLAVPLAVIQSYSMIILLQRSGRGIIGVLGPYQMLLMIATLAAGTMFLMWIGELITEKKIGNGISLIIFAGIVSQIPTSIQQLVVTFDRSQLINMLFFAGLAVITIAGVVYITEAQRNIPVSYAKRVRGNKMYGGTNTYLPLRVNQAGMIPIIFAISIILLPSMIAQFFQRANSVWMVKAAGFVIELFQNQLFYGISYFVLVVAFTYFYTSVIFHPHQIAENLQRQGGFVPGIRPGNPTASYLGKVSQRIMLAGAMSLGLIAVLPLISKVFFTGIGSLVIGGASILIVVSVVLETVKQIEAQLEMREYEGI
ncbi:preprotein translocase subunit SecY [Candidatus Falkowbacteria bacterium]|nr:preprotein translocase subunit SecY [Candidatus Falkowbacteria bacterium]